MEGWKVDAIMTLQGANLELSDLRVELANNAPPEDTAETRDALFDIEAMIDDLLGALDPVQ